MSPPFLWSVDAAGEPGQSRMLAGEGMVAAVKTFFHFFQLLNNWPRAALYIFENTISTRYDERELLFSRPSFLSDGLVNGLEDWRSLYGKVLIDACQGEEETERGRGRRGRRRPRQLEELHFQWSASIHGELVESWNSSTCSSHFFAPHQGEYSVALRVFSSSDLLAIGSGSVSVRDIWLAVLGDSFASGEGNPDVVAEVRLGKPASWLSRYGPLGAAVSAEECHRSRRSWGYKLAEQMASSLSAPSPTALHFSFLACTGASVHSGLLFSASSRAQLDVIARITRERGSGPDVLAMSLGGNDLGYGDILESLRQGDSAHLLAGMESRMRFVSSELSLVSNAVTNLAPRQVLVPYYFDLFRDEHGEVDASCEAAGKLSSSEVSRAERVLLGGLNDLLSRVGTRAGWSVETAIPSVFSTHGICSSYSRIRSATESLRLQGDLQGAFHPTEEAHDRIAELLFRRLRTL